MAVTYQQLGNDATTNNNFTLRANGDGTLSLCKGTSASPTELVKIDSSGNLIVGGISLTPLGQCYLEKSGSNLVLSRFNGKYVFINGLNCEIPSTAPTLAGTGITTTNGVSSGPMQYIYVYMNSGTMTLERSTTAYAADSTYGHKIKSGDSTRTLVGIWAASSNDTWSAIGTEGASWFNPQKKTYSPGNSNPATTSGEWSALSGAVVAPFVTFTGRVVSCLVQSRATHTIATASMFLDLGLDGGTTPQLDVQIQARVSDTGQYLIMSRLLENTFTEGRHTLTPIGGTSAGTLSLDTLSTRVSIFG